MKIPRLNRRAFLGASAATLGLTSLGLPLHDQLIIGLGTRGSRIAAAIAQIRPESLLAIDTDRGTLASLEGTPGLQTRHPEELDAQLLRAERIVLVGALGGRTTGQLANEISRVRRPSAGVFCLPFRFEGEQRRQAARDDLRRLRSYDIKLHPITLDSLIDKLPPRTSLRDAFELGEGLATSMVLAVVDGYVS